MKRIILIISLVAAAAYGCRHTVSTPATNQPADTTGAGSGTGNGSESGSGNNGGTGGTGSSVVCFETQILPIFTGNCTDAGCHGNGSSKKDYTLDSYNGIRFSTNKGIKPGDPFDSEIYEMITEDDARKRMPLGLAPLSDTQIALIRRWISEGANNTTNCGSASTTCNENVFTYSAAIKPIIETHCKGCHSGPATATRPNLTTYDGILTVAQPGGRLVNAVTSGTMPKTGPKLSACQVSQITKWVNAGAQNN